jgi:glucose-1-phosphate thymidylyltransferase
MSASASMTKCVILARGLGTRMRCNDADSLLDAAQASAADSGIKAMVPIGRPFLDYVLSVLVGAGFQRACLVIGPEHNLVRDYYTREQRPTRIEVSFAVQSEALGTANAVLAAEQFAGTDEFLAINSDNYYPIDSLRQIQDLRAPGTVLFQAAELLRQGNIPEDRIRAFAYCVVDRDGFLADIVEKPDTAANLRGDKLISMNCWRFDSRVFPACREVPISSRGEYELPAAVKLAIHGGAKFRVAISHDGVLDLSRRSDIASVAERLKNVRVDL